MGEWKHRLSDKNTETMTGDCSSCGKVKIERAGKNFRCRNAKMEYRQTRGQRIPYHEPNPGVCDICGNTRLVSYDHDHQSGNFRGWLCINCNTALGLVHDDPEHLQKLINYLGGFGKI